MKMKINEKDLVEQAKTDYQAFGALYDKYYPPIYRYILHRVANYSLACDLTSQTFFKALKNLKKFQWQDVSFSSWLYRIAHNEIISYFRKQKLRRFIPLEPLLPFLKAPENSNPEMQVLNSEKANNLDKDFKKLHRVIMKLSPTEQNIITLRFFEKKKIKTIAQILNMPEGTVKSHVHRSLRKLKDYLDQNATKKGGERSK